MSDDAIKQQILDYIKKEYIEDEEEADDLESNTELMESGLIDSFSITSIRDWIERTFAVKIPDDMGTADNFGSVDRIAALIEKRSGAR